MPRGIIGCSRRPLGGVCFSSATTIYIIRRFFHYLQRMRPTFTTNSEYTHACRLSMGSIKLIVLDALFFPASYIYSVLFTKPRCNYASLSMRCPFSRFLSRARTHKNVHVLACAFCLLNKVERASNNNGCRPYSAGASCSGQQSVCAHDRLIQWQRARRRNRKARRPAIRTVVCTLRQNNGAALPR